MEGKAVCEANWVMDGRFVRFEYTSNFAGRPLTVVRYVGFDRHRRKVVETHFESTHTDVMHSEGALSADGKTITCKGAHIDAATGREVSVQTVTTIDDADRFTLVMTYAGSETEGSRVITLVHTRRNEMADTPSLYRIILQVADLERAAEFYSKLLDSKGRRIRGGRHYFDCGPVILAILDPAGGGTKARPMPDHVYFSVKDLKKVHARAAALGCLSKEKVDGDPAGEITKRPWGERSFYVIDPWGNRLCFVEANTVFTGR
jgi:predicted enzyme related to lactoylglutathione lyase